MADETSDVCHGSSCHPCAQMPEVKGRDNGRNSEAGQPWGRSPPAAEEPQCRHRLPTWHDRGGRNLRTPDKTGGRGLSARLPAQAGRRNCRAGDSHRLGDTGSDHSGQHVPFKFPTVRLDIFVAATLALFGSPEPGTTAAGERTRDRPDTDWSSAGLLTFLVSCSRLRPDPPPFAQSRAAPARPGTFHLGRRPARRRHRLSDGVGRSALGVRGAFQPSFNSRNQTTDPRYTLQLQGSVAYAAPWSAGRFHTSLFAAGRRPAEPCAGQHDPGLAARRPDLGRHHCRSMEPVHAGCGCRPVDVARQRRPARPVAVRAAIHRAGNDDPVGTVKAAD